MVISKCASARLEQQTMEKASQSTTDRQASAATIDAQYLAEVVHELRSPLGGVDAMAELLSATKLTADQRRLVEGLRAASKHLRAIADDVLDNQALNNNAYKWQERSFSLIEMLQAIEVAAESRAASKGLWFSLHLQETLPEEITADHRCIRQMIENLLDNAIKVTASGKISLSISRVEQRGQFLGLRFEVKDTGPGFSAMEKETLFKPYSRIDNDVKGTGLGLAMVRRLARAMGGEVGCESQPGHGATFWFSISVKSIIKNASHNAGEIPLADYLNRILVVDDNQSNRQIMQVMLEHFGYQTIEAESGERALEILQTTGVAAVMLDQTLTGISGMETLAAIRTSGEAWASLPVIPVTGRVSSADRIAFAKAGATGFVEKPITARSIRDALELALGSDQPTQKTAA
jgi:nitrogen-specific signal transduction histidine kinase/ActR/RegA family two-component response regulator